MNGEIDRPDIDIIRDDYVDIAARVRLELSKRLSDIASMNASDLHDFVAALQRAQSFELDVHAWEARHRDWMDTLQNRGY